MIEAVLIVVAKIVFAALAFTLLGGLLAIIFFMFLVVIGMVLTAFYGNDR